MVSAGDESTWRKGLLGSGPQVRPQGSCHCPWPWQVAHGQGRPCVWRPAPRAARKQRRGGPSAPAQPLWPSSHRPLPQAPPPLGPTPGLWGHSRPKVQPHGGEGKNGGEGLLGRSGVPRLRVPAPAGGSRRLSSRPRLTLRLLGWARPSEVGCPWRAMAFPNTGQLALRRHLLCVCSSCHQRHGARRGTTGSREPSGGPPGLGGREASHEHQGSGGRMCPCSPSEPAGGMQGSPPSRCPRRHRLLLLPSAPQRLAPRDGLE